MSGYGFTVNTPGPITTLHGAQHSNHWSVELPHQCDEWEITFTTDRAQAITDMEMFIAEAQAALDQLRAAPDTP